jgi:hypothetical protein
MRFIVFSDQHLGSKLYNSPELEYDNRKLFSMVIDRCIELNPDYLVSVGDLFDNNKPTSELIEFVTSELDRLRKQSGTKPLAIAGDHSKPLDGATWEKICGFAAVSSVPEFVGIDYSDNPENVTELMNKELNSRPADSVKFLFLHQQIPELWPFCDDKKKIPLKSLDFSNHCNSLKALFLGDIHIRYEMRYTDPVCKREFFVGYCGSLGVTASNETQKPGLYYWNEDKLQLIEYQLPRKFVSINLDGSNLDDFSEQSYKEQYELEVEKPVFICKYTAEVAQSIDKLKFLYNLGIVKFTRTRVLEDEQEEFLNIRSELKTEDRISEVLKVMTNGKENSKLLYDTVYSLVLSSDPTAILDNLKKTLLEETCV